VAAMLVTVCKEGIDSLEYNVGHFYSQEYEFNYNIYSLFLMANPSEKRAWYERAVNKGNPRALYELGISFENVDGKSKPQDLLKAIDYFQRVYRIGDIDATYKLANIYLHGYGVPQDLKKAFALLNEASEMGNKEAYKTLNSFDINDEEDKNEIVMKCWRWLLVLDM
jgi:TPR repeat protein